MSVELPADLLRPIIAHVSQHKDLCALALVSHAFREEAQRSLFDTTVIVINGTKHFPLLDTIIASPDRLALMTRKTTVKVDLLVDNVASEHYRESGDLEGHVGWFEETEAKTQKALQLMRGLTSLQVVCNHQNDRHAQLRPWMESLLEGCGLRLKVLVWDVLGFNLPNLILKNLADQPNLSTLHISCEYWPADFSVIQQPLSKICSGLQTLSSTWEVICLALGNGAIIPHIEVESWPQFSQLSTPALRKALGYVEYMWCPLSLEPLGFDLKDLRNVVLLQLQWLPEEDLAHISALSRLEVLILLDNWGSSIQASEALEEMIQYLFQSSGSLTTIYVTHFKDPAKTDPYQTSYIYDRSTGEVEACPFAPREVESWRRKSRLDEFRRFPLIDDQEADITDTLT